MHTITKQFKNYPAAHRQHNHDGHCAFVHGHNWTFEITFTATELDENGFVLDFGKMKSIKQWLTRMFDHTLLINEDDPMRRFFEANHCEADGLPDNFVALWDVRIVPNGSAEDLAKYVMQNVQEIIQADGHDGRVQIVSVTVYEDEKNSATYIQEPSQ